MGWRETWEKICQEEADAYATDPKQEGPAPPLMKFVFWVFVILAVIVIAINSMDETAGDGAEPRSSPSYDYHNPNRPL